MAGLVLKFLGSIPDNRHCYASVVRGVQGQMGSKGLKMLSVICCRGCWYVNFLSVLTVDSDTIPKNIKVHACLWLIGSISSLTINLQFEFPTYRRRHPQDCRRSSRSDKGRTVVLI